MAALSADQNCVAAMNHAFKERRDFVVRALNSMPGVSCLPGDGTFYAFAEVSRAMAALNCREDSEFAFRALEAGTPTQAPQDIFGTALAATETALQEKLPAQLFQALNGEPAERD